MCYRQKQWGKNYKMYLCCRFVIVLTEGIFRYENNVYYSVKVEFSTTFAIIGVIDEK